MGRGNGLYKIRRVREGMAQLEELLQEAVDEARADQIPWNQIASVLGLSGEEARAKYGPGKRSSNNEKS